MVDGMACTHVFVWRAHIFTTYKQLRNVQGRWKQIRLNEITSTNKAAGESF